MVSQFHLLVVLLQLQFHSWGPPKGQKGGRNQREHNTVILFVIFGLQEPLSRFFLARKMGFA